MSIIRICVVMGFLIVSQGCASFSGSQKFHFVDGKKFDTPEIVLNSNWGKTESYELKLNNTDIVWHKVVFYKHPEKLWFMSEHTFFGQNIMRAYGIHDDRDNLVGHWFLLKKDNRWFLVESENANLKWVRSNTNTNERIGIAISLIDKHQDVIIDTVVNKK